MRLLVGIALGAASAIAFSWGLTRGLDTACTPECPDPDVPGVALIGGVVGFVIAVFVSRVTWLTSLPIGVVTALVMLRSDGVDLFGEHAPEIWFSVAMVMLGPLIIVGIGLVGVSGARQEAQVRSTGLPAVARVLSAQTTGTFVNEAPQVEITYQVEPLDETPPFSFSHRPVIAPTDVMPRPGLRWPAWFVLAASSDGDPQVSVLRPTGAAITADTLAVYEQRGITLVEGYGYDPGAPADA